MMNEKYFESAEFYQKRFHNFASLWVVPCFLLLLFIVGFSVFAKKEVTLSSRGTIEATRVVDQIQSTSNSPIQVNHLKENKEIKKGEILVEYQHGGEQVQGDTLAHQLQLLKRQEEQLKLLKCSIESGKSQFTDGEHFGYDQVFKDYQEQRGTLRSQIQQQNATLASQNASASMTRAEIGQALQEQATKLSDYQSLRSALAEGASLESNHPLYSLYQTYAQKEAGEEASHPPHQYLSQIDQQIDQLESTLSGYRIQYAGAGSQQALSTSLDSQLASLKSQQLSKIGQELLLLAQQIIELEAKEKAQMAFLQKSRIKATEDGLLHLNEETKGSKIVAEGTPLAQVYPLIQKEKEVKIVTYIASKDIATIRLGDKIRFSTQGSKQKTIQLESRITSIASSATRTEQGNYFKVESVTRLRDQDAQMIRYGLEGKCVMITGEKSYFSFFVDQFLGVGH